MAYDDGFYYGQCKLVCVCDSIEDNGKQVLVTGENNRTWSGTITNKKCEFLVPNRGLYKVQKISSGSAQFTCEVTAGYGECVEVHLDTGYAHVVQGDICAMDFIKAASVEDLENKVPEAAIIKELNNNFVYDDNGYLKGYKTGADTWSPFSGISNLTNISFPYTATNDCRILLIADSMYTYYFAGGDDTSRGSSTVNNIYVNNSAITTNNIIADKSYSHRMQTTWDGRYYSYTIVGVRYMVISLKQGQTLSMVDNGYSSWSGCLIR